MKQTRAKGCRTNLGALLPPDADTDKAAFIDLAGVDFLAGEAPRQYSHGELDSLADGVARGLLSRGLERGAAVTIAAENSVRFFATYLGIMRSGLVAVPLNFKQPREVIAHVLQDSETRLLFADLSRRGLCPSNLPVVALDGEGADSFDDLLDPGTFDPVIPETDETAMLLYTSGSTGLPKGVKLSHAGQLFALSRWDSQREVLRNLRLLIAAPQYHMNALFLSKLTVYMNAGAVLMPRFDAETYIRAIDRFGVTWLTSVPTMLALAVRERAALEQTDRSSVERISMGSAPLTEALYDEVQRWFPQAQISNFYGTTEHGPSAFGPHPEGLPRPKRSIGYPMPDVEVRLAGGANEDEGILEVRSPANLTGYKGLCDKTEADLKDNWYRTGDLMRRDTNGFYYIVGREDDMFVCNGENVYPGEVERLLEAHPAIDQASVVPVEDPIRGHAPVAFVVKAKGASIDEGELQEHARAHGPAYRYPRRVFFVDALPLSGTNKIDRGKLLKHAAELYKDVSAA